MTKIQKVNAYRIKDFGSTYRRMEMVGVRNKAVWRLWGRKDVSHHKETDSPEFKTFVTVRP